MLFFKHTLMWVTIGLICHGCSLMTSRTFEELMDDNDKGVFVPNRDFPVVSGDTGKAYDTAKDSAKRAPPTPQQKKKTIYRKALSEQLVELENKLPSREFRHYMNYKYRLKNDSERILFLKLKSMAARDEFLTRKNILNNDSEHKTLRTHIRSGDIYQGMSKDDVVRSWGRPSRIDVAGDPKYQNERWVFFDHGKERYVFFENGRVNGWVDQ